MTDSSKILADNGINKDESYADSNQKTVGAGDGNAPFIESLYESFLKDPKSISDDWRIYFETLPINPEGKSDVSHKEVIERFKKQRRKRSSVSMSANKNIDDKQIRVIQLIQSYRNRGHQRANLDPLGLRKTIPCEDLDIEFHGLTKNDLNKNFNFRL